MSTTAHSPDVARALADIAAAKADVSSEVADCLDLIADLVGRSPNPTAVFERVATTLAEAQWQKPITPPAPVMGDVLELHGLVLDTGLGAHRSLPITSAMRSLDSNASDAENDQLPLYEAEIVVTNWGYDKDRRQVDGRFTKIWLSHGAQTGELVPAKAREVVAEMRDFADRLDALCDKADKIAADDFAEKTGA